MSVFEDMKWDLISPKSWRSIPLSLMFLYICSQLFLFAGAMVLAGAAVVVVLVVARVEEDVVVDVVAEVVVPIVVMVVSVELTITASEPTESEAIFSSNR